MKYEIEVGAFVEHIAHRKYVINANSTETAFEKAKKGFMTTRCVVQEIQKYIQFISIPSKK